MSLNSLLSNLFASEPPSRLVPASQEAGGIKHNVDREDGTNSANARQLNRMRPVEKTEADGDIELKRPPYVHVRPLTIYLMRSGY
jgi:hypothetical protein